MRIFYLTAGFVVFALLLVSGCISDSERGETDSYNEPVVEIVQSPQVPQENAEVEQEGESPEIVPEEVPEKTLPDGANIMIESIEIEKDLYYSAELMRFNATINSDTYLDEVSVKASGISGKMNLEKTVNLTEGDNIVEFEFGLPRCNVCGGIRAGTHTVNVGVYYGELIAEHSASVEIEQ